jgi:hypothetical protein
VSDNLDTTYMENTRMDMGIGAVYPERDVEADPRGSRIICPDVLDKFFQHPQRRDLHIQGRSLRRTF